MSGISPNETLIDFLGRKPQPLPQPGIMPISDDPVRQEYNRLKKEAADMRANGFMGRVVLPTENQTFEEYRDDPQRTYKETGKLLTAGDSNNSSNNSLLPMDMGGNGSMYSDPRGPTDAQFSAMASPSAPQPIPNGAIMTRPMRPGPHLLSNSIIQPDLKPMRPAHSGPHLPNNPMNPINKIPYTSIGQPLKQPLPLIAGTPIGEPANPGFNTNTGLSISSTTLNKPTQPQVYGGK